MTDTPIYNTRALLFDKVIQMTQSWVLELNSEELQQLLPFIAGYEILPRRDEDLVICIAEELRFPTIDLPYSGSERERQIDELHKVISLKLAHDVQVKIMRRRGELGGQADD